MKGSVQERRAFRLSTPRATSHAEDAGPPRGGRCRAGQGAWSSVDQTARKKAETISHEGRGDPAGEALTGRRQDDLFSEHRLHVQKWKHSKYAQIPELKMAIIGGRKTTNPLS